MRQSVKGVPWRASFVAGLQTDLAAACQRVIGTNPGMGVSVITTHERSLLVWSGMLLLFVTFNESFYQPAMCFTYGWLVLRLIYVFYACLLVCASPPITCAIIASSKVLPCDLIAQLQVASLSLSQDTAVASPSQPL